MWSSYRDWEEANASVRGTSSRVVDALESTRSKPAATPAERAAPVEKAPAPVVKAPTGDRVLDAVHASARTVAIPDHVTPRARAPAPKEPVDNNRVRLIFLTGDGQKVARLLTKCGIARVLDFKCNQRKHRTTVVTFSTADADKILGFLIDLGRPDYCFVEDVVDEGEEEESEDESEDDDSD
jgi:hypothetical protein